jgi:hypothetical protein
MARFRVTKSSGARQRPPPRLFDLSDVSPRRYRRCQLSTFVPAENTAKVVVEGQWAGNDAINTLWFQFASEPDQTDLETLAEYVWENLLSALQSTWAASYQVNRVTATRQNSENDIQGVYDAMGTPLVGSGSGASVPLNASWSISFRTGLRGRSYRGRNYAAGYLNSILDDPGRGNATVLAGVAAAYVQHLITNMLAGWTWVVASHVADKAPRVAAVLTPIISVIIDTYVDSQRRRLVGRGK